jgi:hypothetical protein
MNLVTNMFSQSELPNLEEQLLINLQILKVYKEEFASSQSVAVFSLQHPSYRTLPINNKQQNSAPKVSSLLPKTAHLSLAILP